MKLTSLFYPGGARETIYSALVAAQIDPAESFPHDRILFCEDKPSELNLAGEAEVATETQRSKDGIIILTETDKLYMIPASALSQYEYTGTDKGSRIDSLIKTGRLRNLKAARQIDTSTASQDVSLFGGTFPDTQ